MAWAAVASSKLESNKKDEATHAGIRGEPGRGGILCVGSLLADWYQSISSTPQK
jgi:hypothetical protein